MILLVLNNLALKFDCDPILEPAGVVLMKATMYVFMEKYETLL